jgi:hypothetical protein
MLAFLLALYYILFYNPYTDIQFQHLSEDGVLLHDDVAPVQPTDPYAFRRQLGFSVPPTFKAVSASGIDGATIHT